MEPQCFRNAIGFLVAQHSEHVAQEVVRPVCAGQMMALVRSLWSITVVLGPVCAPEDLIANRSHCSSRNSATADPIGSGEFPIHPRALYPKT